MQDIRLTIREIAGVIQERCGRLVPDWKLRRVVDALEADKKLDVQRVGMYRTVSSDDVNVVAGELRRLGWLPTAEVCE